MASAGYRGIQQAYSRAIARSVRGARAVVMREMGTFRRAVEGEVRGNLSGGTLQVRSGRLLGSLRVTGPTAASGAAFANVNLSVGVGIPYGRIHEYGGQTRAHVILPRKASVLAFMMRGKKIFAKMVKHPGSRIPPRMGVRNAWGRHYAQAQAAIRGGLRALRARSS